MSKIGQKQIIIPEGTTVTIKNNLVEVSGPKGKISKDLNLDGFEIEIKNNILKVIPKSEKLNKDLRSKWGTYRAIINNLVSGVNEEFSKILEFSGIGYRADVENNQLNLHFGFSHPVIIEIPDDLKVETTKSQIIIKGINKEKVGQFASDIRKIRKVEPYKGRGVKYADETVRRKVGKKLGGINS
ncbi:MAG TPA: 50S ribosomal protein L6 [Candidatus Paceibacterota bacterium]|jgi:large subunit ribosomal protein L6|nr:50S ribosomal protein L6 [Candidatus Paceibacterota bacterium]HRS47674.1 50S ribosomal protein L6 [Candidatus Paceibacterota bacterium]